MFASVWTRVRLIGGESIWKDRRHFEAELLQRPDFVWGLECGLLKRNAMASAYNTSQLNPTAVNCKEGRYGVSTC
jgi:hypothetical protein